MIRKVIKNRQKTKEDQKDGVKVYPTEEILGSMVPIRDFAAFYVKHKEDLEVIRASTLLDFCEDQQFTPEQLQFFRMGQETYKLFFENAEADLNAYLADAAAQNRKSVG